MKKIFTLILLVVLSFTLLSCGTSSNSGQDNTGSQNTPSQKNDEQTQKTSIVLPNGTPAIASIFALDDTKDYDYTLTNGPQGVAAEFAKNQADLIFAPTNAGMKVWNGGTQNYQLAASMVNVNLFILNTEGVTDFNNIPDNTKIVSFGQGLPPQIVLDDVKGSKPLDVEYQSSIDTTKQLFVSGQYKYVVLLEPLATAVQAMMKKNKNITVSRIPLSALYNQKNNVPDGLPFASLFVKKSLPEDRKNKIVKDFVEKAKQVTVQNIDKVCDAVQKLNKIALPVPVIKQALGRSGIKPEYASEQLFKVYVDKLLAVNSGKSIGGKAPSSDFYFTAK